jgi:hypothetical protein
MIPRRLAHQRALWKAFLRYAKTHPEVLGTIPDRAYVVLIPETNPLDGNDALTDLVQCSLIPLDTPIACVYLETWGGPSGSDLTPLPFIADAHVEVLERADARPGGGAAPPFVLLPRGPRLRWRTSRLSARPRRRG